jgi:isocitrate/isopropylmalate dehydrogenase
MFLERDVEVKAKTGEESEVPEGPYGMSDAELLAYFKECKKKAFDHRWQWERVWMRNIHYVNNRQWITYIRRANEWVDVKLAKWIPKPVINQLGEGVMALRAMFTSVNIGVNVRPVGDDPKAVAESVAIVTRFGCERIIRYAFEYAVANGRKKVTVVHKANILKMVSGLFLEVGRKVAAEYTGRIEFNDMIVDNAAMQLVLRPEQFDVLVTTNMFGDILSDEVSGLVGGLGLAPGGNIGTRAAIFEAVHGSAPDIAGKGIANPAAQMLAAAMLLDHLGETAHAGRLRAALEAVIVEENVRTRDLGGTASTREFGDAVANRVR